jgi:RHS repeat-associated protein
LKTLTPPTAYGTGSFGFAYDALSRRTGLTRPNSVNTAYSYDNLSHLLSVTHANAGTTLDGASYTVDNAGNRQSRTSLPGTTATNYTYDAIYQLLSAVQGGTTQESYTYDPVGNRLTSLGVSSYTTNSSNELTAKTGEAYTYDNNGNTLTKADSTGTTTYAWDFENRLTSVALPGSGGTVSFKYDPFGRRIYKSSSAGTSIFAYDEDNLIEETNSSGAAVARYAQGLLIDEPLAMLRSSTTSYYELDGLGSITSLSSPAGALAQTYTYDSLGNLTASTGSLVNPFRYTGREFDTETNLQYSRARYYDPATGRFLSEDPIGFRGGLNLYRYVKNQPTRYVDPTGKAISSVDAAMEQAIARGDLAEIEELLQTVGDELSPGMRQAGQAAVDNGGVDAGGAKSARELVKHLKYLQRLKDELAGLRKELCEATQKARPDIQKRILDLLKAIAGHIKEIGQKWGIGF